MIAVIMDRDILPVMKCFLDGKPHSFSEIRKAIHWRNGPAIRGMIVKCASHGLIAEGSDGWCITPDGIEYIHKAKP